MANAGRTILPVLAGLFVLTAVAAAEGIEGNGDQPLSEAYTRKIVGLINTWAVAGATCRSADPALQATIVACASEHRLLVELDDLGWCYGRMSDPGGRFFSRWHRCDKDSLHPQRP